MSLGRLVFLCLFAGQCLYSITWLNDIDQALVIAAKEDKPVIAYFTGSWCIWCQKLDEQVLNQPSFEKLASKFILAKVNYPQNSKDYTKNLERYKRTYQVYSYPTLLILSPQGKLLGSVGYPRDSAEEYFAKIRFLAGLQEDSKKEPVKAHQSQEQQDSALDNVDNPTPGLENAPTDGDVEDEVPANGQVWLEDDEALNSYKEKEKALQSAPATPQTSVKAAEPAAAGSDD